MVGQHYLEKYYSRGSSRTLTSRQLAAVTDAEGVPPANVKVVGPGTPGTTDIDNKENR
jgi:polar amino acid transport system permease protein